MAEILSIYPEIRSIIEQARHKVYSAVNTAMVEAYWQIGKRIVEEEQKGKERAEYGTSLIANLAIKLTAEFGKGFNQTNLKYFRQFYLAFPVSEKGHTVCDQLKNNLSWSHYRFLMRIENRAAREYYTQEASDFNWSVRQLERNINSLYYERLLSTNQKQEALQSASQLEKQVVADYLKDPFVLEFLGLPHPPGFSESEFETSIVANLQQFLLELGKGFSFVGRQYRITTETKNFFIDLVFYNFHLKCFILIDLKIGELTHQDIGQMDMYVRLFEDKIKGYDDNPTVGIILCTEKDETIVKYSVLKENQQIFASRYKTYLPTEEELRIELERERRMFEQQGVKE
jgi:predicted nuclease of restriction endonuclease-like (RecB) superfamily